MKKILKVALLAISALALFAGCKQNGDPSDTGLPERVGANPFVNENTEESVYYYGNLQDYYFTKDKVIYGSTVSGFIPVSNVQTFDEVSGESETADFPYEKYGLVKEYSYSWNTETGLLVLKPMKITDPENRITTITIEEYADKISEKQFDEEYQKSSYKKPISIPSSKVNDIVAYEDETGSTDEEEWETYWAGYIANAKKYFGLEDSATIDDLKKASKKSVMSNLGKIEYCSFYLSEDGESLSLSLYNYPGISLADYFKKYTIPSVFINSLIETDKYDITMTGSYIQLYSRENDSYGYFYITDITDSVIKLESYSGDLELTELPYTASLDDKDNSKWTIKLDVNGDECTLPFYEQKQEYTKNKK